jgi:catechol 2,3-dioxygenase-like lactoylglutathione lyase family enzyme
MNRLFTALFASLLALPSFATDPPQRSKIFSICLVRFRSTDIDKADTFYSKELGMRNNFGGRNGYFRVGEHQGVEMVPGASSSSGSFVEMIGFYVENLEQMRIYLTAYGIDCAVVRSKRGETPATISAIGGPEGYPTSLSVSDPEGHKLIFLEFPLLSGGPNEIDNAGQVSNRLIHIGFVVHDRAAEDKFYKDILGFHLYWQGGRKDGETDWVNMQVPDGTDWIEYMLNVPANADHHTLGVMNHIALGVPDIHAAEAQLRKNGWTGTEEPKIGRGGKWQLNLYDPDDTRVELMEFTPVQKPCCSEYTGPHPGPNR